MTTYSIDGEEFETGEYLTSDEILKTALVEGTSRKIGEVIRRDRSRTHQNSVFYLPQQYNHFKLVVHVSQLPAARGYWGVDEEVADANVLVDIRNLADLIQLPNIQFLAVGLIALIRGYVDQPNRQCIIERIYCITPQEYQNIIKNKMEPHQGAYKIHENHISALVRNYESITSFAQMIISEFRVRG